MSIPSQEQYVKPSCPIPSENGYGSSKIQHDQQVIVSPSAELKLCTGASTRSSLELVEDNIRQRKKAVIKYMECLKNHAAAIGGHATDGCGEYMPGEAEGSIEALKCSACNCHRNFHRKVVQGDQSSIIYTSHECHQTLHPLLTTAAERRGKLGHGKSKPEQNLSHEKIELQTSEADEPIGLGTERKRCRTRFTQEQKEKMLSFAEKVGWKIQKLDANFVHHFCQEIGINRGVLKVWMHNNKHNLAKKSISATSLLVSPQVFH